MSSQNGLSSLTTFQEWYRINVDSMMMMMLMSLGPQNVIQCQNVVPTRMASWELTEYLHSTIWATNCMYLPGIREVELGDSKLLPNELPSCYLGETTTNNLTYSLGGVGRSGDGNWTGKQLPNSLQIHELFLPLLKLFVLKLYVPTRNTGSESGDCKLLSNELPSCYLCHNNKFYVLTRKGGDGRDRNWQTVAKFFANLWTVSLTIRAHCPDLLWCIACLHLSSGHH